MAETKLQIEQKGSADDEIRRKALGRGEGSKRETDGTRLLFLNNREILAELMCVQFV